MIYPPWFLSPPYLINLRMPFYTLKFFLHGIHCCCCCCCFRLFLSSPNNHLRTHTFYIILKKVNIEALLLRFSRFLKLKKRRFSSLLLFCAFDTFFIMNFLCVFFSQVKYFNNYVYDMKRHCFPESRSSSGGKNDHSGGNQYHQRSNTERWQRPQMNSKSMYYTLVIVVAEEFSPLIKCSTWNKMDSRSKEVAPLRKSSTCSYVICALWVSKRYVWDFVHTQHYNI